MTITLSVPPRVADRLTLTTSLVVAATSPACTSSWAKEGVSTVAVSEIYTQAKHSTRSPSKGRQDKLHAMKNVALGAAHDMGNLLSVMGFELDALAIEMHTPKGGDAIASLRAEIAYLAGLGRELQIVATESEAPDTDHLTRLAAWWPDMRVLLRAVHHRGISIRASIPWGLPAVCIKADSLTQVILNLVGNAVHAMDEHPSDDGDTVGRTCRTKRREVEISARLAARGKVISISVTDNGAGMTPLILSHACDPFFTTRADRGGTGLGLAMIRRLIGEAGGRVRLSSVVGMGTTVTVELPTGDAHGALPQGIAAFRITQP